MNKPEAQASGEPYIYAHWHGDELLLIGPYIGAGLAVMASRSRDGSLQKRILEAFGYWVVRGSSSRGGAGGLKGLIDAVARGKRSACVAVDGPRGPRYQWKPGALKLAQKTRAKVVLGTGAAKRRVTFEKAWNKCFLPLPFSPVVIQYSEPIEVSPELTDVELEAIRVELEQRMIEQKNQTEALFQKGSVSVSQTGCSAVG